MKHCPICKQSYADESKFCTFCGEALESKEPDSLMQINADNTHSVSGAANLSAPVLQIQDYLPVIFGAVVIAVYWLPWIKIQALGLGAPLTGADLASQQSTLYFVPIYGVAVIASFMLVHMNIIARTVFRNISLWGFAVVIFGFFYMWYEINEAISQFEALRSGLFGPSKGAGSAQVSQFGAAAREVTDNLVSFTLWFYVEIMALLGTAAAAAVNRSNK